MAGVRGSRTLPATRRRRRSGFEDRETHRDPSTPARTLRGIAQVAQFGPRRYDRRMSIEGEYIPNKWQVAADQVALFERTQGREGNLMQGMPIIVITMRGNKSGAVRKVPLMRVEHDGKYAAVASLGGAPKHPVWYYNIVANPDVTLQDGATIHELRAREVTGDEKAEWWKRAVAAYPPYADYQARTERTIPLFVLEPR